MLSKQVDKQAFIFLKDVSFPDLRALVDYMYKGEVNVAQEQLASFLQTAEALDIKGIFKMLWYFSYHIDPILCSYRIGIQRRRPI